MSASVAGATIRVALRNVRLVRLVAAYSTASLNEWAIWLAAVVYAEQRHGTAVAGWVALALVVPSLTVAPFVGRLLEGVRPIRSLTVVQGVGASALAASAILGGLDAPLAAVVAPAAIGAGTISIMRPAYASVAPGMVRSINELTSASLIGGFCDSGASLVGPIAATVVVATTGPSALLAGCATLSVLGMISTLSLRAHDRVDAVNDEDGPSSLIGAVRSLKELPGLPSLLVVLSGQYVLLGVLDVMFIVIAVDILGIASSGAGILNIAFGVGALLSTIGVTMLVGRVRLAPIIGVSLGVVACTLLLLAGTSTVSVAIFFLALAGLSQGVIDSASQILLQRSTAPHRLASVFGLIEVLVIVGTVIGTVMAQVAVTTLGASEGLILLGVGLLIVLLLTARQVSRADRSADVPVVSIALMRTMPLFAPLSPATIEAVARSARERQFEAGDLVIREGDEGHSYFVIVDGEVDVSVAGRHIRRSRRGDGVGELALLAGTPRSATVAAVTSLQVLEIDREPFLVAITGNGAALTAAWRRIRGLEGIDHMRDDSWLEPDGTPE